MVWVLLDVALVLLGLLLVGLAGLRLYRAVRALLRRAGEASDRIGAVSGGLALDPPPAHR